MPLVDHVDVARRRDEDIALADNVFQRLDLVLAEGWWLTKKGRPRPEPEIRVGQVRDLIGEIAGAPFEAPASCNSMRRK